MIKTITTTYIDDEGNTQSRSITLKESAGLFIKFKEFFGTSLLDEKSTEDTEYGFKIAYLASYPKVYDKMSYEEFLNTFSLSELVPIAKGANDLIRDAISLNNSIVKN